MKEVLSRLKAYIDAHPDVRDDPNIWIEGMGWDQTKWSGAQFPSAVRLRIISRELCDWFEDVNLG
jgi:hypothetical protein